MSALDDRMAEERARLKLVRDLTDRERADLLGFLCQWNPALVDAWFWDREADSSGTRYDAWGRASRPAGDWLTEGFTGPEDSRVTGG